MPRRLVRPRIRVTLSTLALLSSLEMHQAQADADLIKELQATTVPEIEKIEAKVGNKSHPWTYDEANESFQAANGCKDAGSGLDPASDKVTVSGKSLTIAELRARCDKLATELSQMTINVCAVRTVDLRSDESNRKWSAVYARPATDYGPSECVTKQPPVPPALKEYLPLIRQHCEKEDIIAFKGTTFAMEASSPGVFFKWLRAHCHRKAKKLKWESLDWVE